MRFPHPGNVIEIQSYKHDGTLHRVWDETWVLYRSTNTIIGGNHRTTVTESNGEQWYTKEPAITYFSTEKWFNVIAMLRETGVHYYCNLGSPVTWDGEALKYIDYDLDIKVFPNMSYRLLDEDEYSEHKQEMNYPDQLDHILRSHVSELIEWIEKRKGPFNQQFTDKWYDAFKQHVKAR